jgi:DNA-directed RNA polymerase specialized sigma24 family protein
MDEGASSPVRKWSKADWDSWVEEHRPRLVRALWSKAPPKAEEDIVQFALMKLWQRRESVENPWAYCLRVAYREAMRVSRHERRWNTTRSSVLAVGPESPTADDRPVAMPHRHASSDPALLANSSAPGLEDSGLDSLELEVRRQHCERIFKVHHDEISSWFSSKHKRTDNPERYQTVILSVIEEVLEATAALTPGTQIDNGTSQINERLERLMPEHFSDPETSPFLRRKRLQRAREDINKVIWWIERYDQTVNGDETPPTERKPR